MKDGEMDDWENNLCDEFINTFYSECLENSEYLYKILLKKHLYNFWMNKETIIFFIIWFQIKIWYTI